MPISLAIYAFSGIVAGMTGGHLVTVESKCRRGIRWIYQGIRHQF